MILSAVVTESGSDSHHLGSFAPWGYYMNDVSLFMYFVYSALFINALLTCSKYRDVTYRSASLMATDRSHTLAATSSFFLTGSGASATSGACDLGA